MFRRILAFVLILFLILEMLSGSFAVPTNNSSTPWSREKAEHLASAALFGATQSQIDALYLAGSAASAIDILFPDRNGPDRTDFNQTIVNYTASGFNWGDGSHTSRLYQLVLYKDPYEAKRKFLGLFEDIYSVGTDGTKITAKDIFEQHNLLFQYMFTDYKTLVKRLLFNNGNPGDYAEGAYLDLFNQNNPKNPNENYARELLQLFLMGEYEPHKSIDNNDVRNYEESDVKALARILTGLRADPDTHRVTYDSTYHNTGSAVAFLTGELIGGVNFPFYNSMSGTLDLVAMETSILGNNGLTDNTIDYIFAKRSKQIALFLADRMYRFYIHDTPTREELDLIAANIEANNFDMYVSVRQLLTSDMMYTDKAMNGIRFKNPLELTIGTVKLLHANDSNTAIDPNILDANLLRRLNWTPYYPGSVFGRDGFDDNKKWITTGTQNAWISATNYFVYNTSTGSININTILPAYRRMVTSENIAWVTHSGNTLSGSMNVLSGSFNLENGGSGNIIGFNTILPTGYFTQGGNSLFIDDGEYNGNNKKLTIRQGRYISGEQTILVNGGEIEFDSVSTLEADIYSASGIYELMRSTLLGGKTLPEDVTTKILYFLSHDQSGSLIPATPSKNTFMLEKIRGTLSLVLSMPEYVLLRGWDKTYVSEGNDDHTLDNIPGRLVFIELYGGNDYLNNIIPTNEYDTYVSYRTNESGSIVLSGSDLTILDANHAMNTYLAYGSGMSDSFKSLYDAGYLSIFNRVGTPKHSQDHDAAAKQMASYDNTTAATALGVFGQLVMKEFESSHTISLGAKSPNVFRGGRYVNLGGSIILTNPSNGSYKKHIDVIADIMRTRSYPGDTTSLFKNAVNISDIGKTSQAQGGPTGANGDMKNVFKFLEVLLSNDIGRSYYMGGYGGYDTHGDQIETQNRNLRFLGEAVTTFFNKVKNTEDITIVIFSEFGRTNKVNTTLGTDHGDAGGIYIITSNNTLRNNLNQKIYGTLSIKNTKANSLGVGIDYRSVYGKVYNALYGKSDRDYFGTRSWLEDDIVTTPVNISRYNIAYQVSGTNILANIGYNIEGNYDSTKAGYTRLTGGTGAESMKNISIKEVKEPLPRYTGQVNSRNHPIYTIRAFSNQYTETSYTGSLGTGSTPLILGNTLIQPSYTGNSILTKFNNTSVPTILANTGILLANNMSGETILPLLSGDSIRFQTGSTRINELLSSSGTLKWNGGFILGEYIPTNLFVSKNARILPDDIVPTNLNVKKILHIGADQLGVGMVLSQPVIIEYNNLIPGEKYRVITTEDGYTWTDVATPYTEYSVNASGTLTFSTNRFSYFALLSATTLPPTIPPSCNLSILPSDIILGSGATVTWTSENATSIVLIGSGTLTTSSGSYTVIPTQTGSYSYQIEVGNTSGSGVCSAQLIVHPNQNGSGSTSSGSTNSGTTNSGTTNTGSTNSGTTNTGTTNSGSTNSGSTNSGSTNSGSTNSGSTNSGSTNSGSTNSGSTNSGSTNSGSTNSGSTNSGSTNSGSTNTGSTNSGSTNSGSTSTGTTNSGTTNSGTTIIPSSPSPSGGGGGRGRSIPLPKVDICPNGDMSASIYDGKCALDTQSTNNTSSSPMTYRPSYYTDKIHALLTSLPDSTRIVNGALPQTVLRDIRNTTYQIKKHIEKTATPSEQVILEKRIREILENIQKDTTENQVKKKILSLFIENFKIKTYTTETKEQDLLDTVTENITNKLLFRYVNSYGELRMRSTPKVRNDNIIAFLSHDTRVEIISEENSWTKIRAGRKEGYVKTFYLRDTPPLAENILPQTEQGLITSYGMVFVRSTPNALSRIKAILPGRSTLPLLGKMGKWWKVKLDDSSEGYIHESLIQPL